MSENSTNASTMSCNTARASHETERRAKVRKVTHLLSIHSSIILPFVGAAYIFISVYFHLLDYKLTEESV
jgi:hypothetical protein